MHHLDKRKLKCAILISKIWTIEKQLYIIFNSSSYFPLSSISINNNLQSLFLDCITIH